MLLRLRNAVASMGELVQRQDRVAHNLANANTVGYQRDRSFAQALDERLDAEGAPRSTRVAGQWADPTAGALQETGGPLHLAIEGEGYFTVQDASGQTRLTRAGEFVLDTDGAVRSPSGLALLRDDGTPLTLPPSGGAVEITTGGEVRVGGTPVGRVGVVVPADARSLVRLDGASYATVGVALRPAEGARVRQGFLESSNVDAVREMTDLIAHVRLFESQQKALQTTDDVLGAVTRALGTF